MIKGTTFTHLEMKSQQERTYSITENFMSEINPWFDRILADIAMLKQSSENKSQIDEWGSVLRKVIRLYDHEVKDKMENKSKKTAKKGTTSTKAS